MLSASPSDRYNVFGMRNLLTRNMHTTRSSVSCTSIFFPHYFFHFTQLTFFCLRSLRTAYHAYLFIVNQFFFRRHNLHTSPHANPMTLRCALTIELTSPIMFLVCQHLRSSKTLLLTERLSFLKGYQNGSSINADPVGFRVKLYIFSDS